MEQNRCEQGFYDDARLYDILHKPGTAGEVTGLEAIADRFVPHEARHWLEPACGTARYLRDAAGRGRRVTGFDLSEGMIEYARTRIEARGLGARADLFIADMTDFASLVKRPVDLAFNLINTVRHLDTDAAMLTHLEQVAASLAPGGVYAVGLSTAAYGLEQETEDVWTAKRGGTRLTQTVQYLPPSPEDRVERVISNLAVRERGEQRFIDSAYPLRSYSTEQWLDLIGRSALRLVGVVDDEGEDVEPPVFGYAVYVLGG